MKRSRNISFVRSSDCARGRTAVGLLGMAMMAAAVPVASAQTFTRLGSLPGRSWSFANAVSADGSTVVGSAYDSSGAGHAFRWTQQEGMLDLGVLPGATTSGARPVSADGSVVAGDSGGGAFVWTRAGGMRDLGVLPGAVRSSATAVSADGSVVVGFSDDGPQGGFRHAFLWSWTDGMLDLGLLPGGTRAVATGVSADGAVVIGSADTPDGDRAFRWTAAEGMQSLVLPLQGSSLSSYACGVSSDGSVVAGGTAYTYPPEYGFRFAHLFLWTSADGYDDISGGDSLLVARALSADGSTIVGVDNFDVLHPDQNYYAAFGWNRVLGRRVIFEEDWPSEAIAVNSDGSVILGLRWGEPVLWTRDAGRVEIAEFLTAANIDLSGWELIPTAGSIALSLDGDGRTLVGTGRHRGQYEAWIARLAACPADFNLDGQPNSQDFFNYLNAFFAGDARADIDVDGTVDSGDFFAFLDAFFAGCP